MSWRLTSSRAEFEAEAADFLRSDPVRHTVPLTVLDSLRQSGDSAFGDVAPIFGWHQSTSASIDGAFLQTPPFPVLLASLPSGSAGDLVQLLGARLPGALNLPEAAAAEVTEAWNAKTGGSATVSIRTRLFRLDSLTPPDPFPPGVSRVATLADYDVLVAWLNAFHRDTEGTHHQDAGRVASDRLSYGGLSLWEADGQPVAMAGITRTVAGVARVAPVYTTPAYRRRGYGGAITTAVSSQAITDGASDVVLYTDQANPTSNALYQRLGYRPIVDWVGLVLQ